MKYLLVLAVVLIAFWLWRSGREKADAQTQRRTPPKAPGAPGAAVNMVSCAVCGLHLPQTDAVRGAKALYCGQPHRQAAEP